MGHWVARVAAKMLEIAFDMNLERLSRLISDMLFIARADHDEDPLNRESVELSQVAQRVADYMSLVAEERGLTIEVTGTAAVMADPLHDGEIYGDLAMGAFESRFYVRREISSVATHVDS